MHNNKRLIKIYFITVASILVVFSIAFAIAGAYYTRSVEQRLAKKKEEMELLRLQTEKEENPSHETDVEEREKIPNRTIFGIYGVDANEALADVIIVASFDKNSKEISTLSIPRDTYVVMPPDRLKQLTENGRAVPYDGGMKINAVHSYAGELGNEYLTKQLEELLAIDIDYYIEVNLKAFNKIVDDIGGVEIDVPQRMYYSDPTQNLLIDLKPGKQLLTGDDAAGFVRYRSFLRGDIDRIESQKVFMQELIKQSMSRQNITKTIPSIISSFAEYVDTDMSVIDMLKYAPYINDIDTEKIYMETLPGDGMTPYNHYPYETGQIVDRLFYGVKAEEEPESIGNAEESEAEASPDATVVPQQ